MEIRGELLGRSLGDGRCGELERSVVSDFRESLHRGGGKRSHSSRRVPWRDCSRWFCGAKRLHIVHWRCEVIFFLGLGL